MTCKGTRGEGFTLIELVTATVIVVVLITCALVNYARYRADATRLQCIANLKLMREAAWSYLADHPKLNAGTNAMNANYTLTIEEMVAGKYLVSTPVCPRGGVYTINGGSALGALSLYGGGYNPRCSLWSSLGHDLGFVNPSNDAKNKTYYD